MDYEVTEGKHKGTVWYWCNDFGYARHTKFEGVVYLTCKELNCPATAKLSLGKLVVTHQHTCSPCPQNLLKAKLFMDLKQLAETTSTPLIDIYWSKADEVPELGSLLPFVDIEENLKRRRLQASSEAKEDDTTQSNSSTDINEESSMSDADFDFSDIFTPEINIDVMDNELEATSEPESNLRNKFESLQPGNDSLTNQSSTPRSHKKKSTSSPSKEPMFVDPRLPPGWSRTLVQRQSGKHAGRYDVFVHQQSTGKKFRNRAELKSYFDKIGETFLVPEDFDFFSTGTGPTLGRFKDGEFHGNAEDLCNYTLRLEQEQTQMNKIFEEKRKKKEEKRLHDLSHFKLQQQQWEDQQFQRSMTVFPKPQQLPQLQQQQLQQNNDSNGSPLFSTLKPVKMTLTGNLMDNYIKDSSEPDDPKAICKECGRVYNLKITTSFVLSSHLRKEHSIICTQLPKNGNKRIIQKTESPKQGLLAPFSYLKYQGITISPSKKSKIESHPKVFKKPTHQPITITHSISNAIKLTNSTKCSTLDSKFVKSNELYSPNDPKQLRTDLEVVAMLAQCNLPFSHVENQGFKRLISHLDPKVSVKSADTYSKIKLPLLYKNVQREVHRVLQKDLPHCEGVAFTVCDISVHDHVTIFEVHYIDKDWLLKSFVVDCSSKTISLDDITRKIPGLEGCAHTTVLQNDSVNYDVTNDKMICCETILNRAVQHALDSTPDVQAVLMKCRKLIADLEANPKFQRMTGTVAGGFEEDLPKIEPGNLSKWTINFKCAESVLKMRKNLEQIKVNEDSLPTAEEFHILKAIFPPLAKCLEFVEDISSPNQVNIHKVASHLHRLENFLSNYNSTSNSLGHTLAQELANQLRDENNFKYCGLNHLPIAIAHFFNPCDKGGLLKKFSDYKDTISKINKNLEVKMNRLVPDEDSEQYTKGSSSSGTQHGSSFEDEIKTYEEMIITESKQDLDIQIWWKQHAEQLPLLASLARTHLCVPASVHGWKSQPGFSFEETACQLMYIKANLNRVGIKDWELEEDNKELIANASDGELVIGI